MQRLVVFILIYLSLGFAQTSVDELRQNIQNGLYTSVVQVLAPDLLEREPNNPEVHLLFAYALYYTSDFARARLRV